MTHDQPEASERRISMGNRILAAGDGAVPLLMRLQQQATVHALMAHEALEPENPLDGPDVEEAKDRLGRIIHLLLWGEE